MVMVLDIQNRELRFMAMVDVYDEQKQRASRTSLVVRYFNLSLLASKQVSQEPWSQ